MLDRLPLFYGDTCGYMYSLWCPGKTIWLQEDAVALLSLAMYDRYIFPADCRITEAFEHVAMHLHPTRYIPSELLSRSAVSVVELHIDHDGPGSEALCWHYMTTLRTKLLLIWGDITESDLKFILTTLPPQGLTVNVVVQSPAEAHDIWDLSMALWERRAQAVGI